jgi:xanthine dehydrogenase accessory factor
VSFRTDSLLSILARLEAQRQPFCLATVTDTGGSTPRLAGAMMAIGPDYTHGTIGGGAFEHRVVEDARALLEDARRRTHTLSVHLVRDLAMCCGGKMTVFMQKVEPAPRLRIFGAGHVGTALASAAAAAGFEVTVIDERAEWADAARFEDGIRVEDADPEDHLRAEPVEADEYVVIVTHSHPLDESLVRLLAERPLRFLGLVGSRGKWGRFRKRLLARDISEDALDRVSCPVGVDIGAVTPEEIAVSVVAELVRRRRAG